MDRILFIAVPPTSSQVFISYLNAGFSRIITLFTCKEKLSKLKLSLISDNRASGGAAVTSFIYQRYAFIVTATRLEGSIEGLSQGIHLFWNRWSHVESQNVFCLFCSGLVWQMEAVTWTLAGKVTERCCTLREIWAVIVCQPKSAFSLSTLYVNILLSVWFIFLLVPTYKNSPQLFWLLHIAMSIMLLSHFSKEGTRLMWVQSAHNDTIIGLNKKTKNRQPVPSGPLLFLLLPCL